MSGAGYSGTPLPRKLGIDVGGAVAILGDPGSAVTLLEPLPDGVQLDAEPCDADVVLWFVTERAALEERIDRLGRDVFPDRSLWVSWPKRASGVATDLTEDVVREVALPLGLVDNKVCAIDATWSGLRLVWRRELRATSSRSGQRT
jgi:hypothetical protein